MTKHHAVTWRTLLACALAAGIAAPAGAAAGSANAWGQARGFSLGLGLQIDGLSIDGSQPGIDEIGSGLALVGGYSFTPHFHTRLTIGSAQHGTAVQDLNVFHSGGTLEGHYRFMPDRQVCPYLFGAFGGTELRADQGGNHIKFTGSVAGIGAGLLVGFTPHFAMDLNARLEALNWQNAEWSVDQPGGGTLKYSDSIEESGGSSRLHIGVLWQF